MNAIKQLKNQFIELWGQTDAEIFVFHAPGRVNLIGEHIDYNGGYVFPAALSVGTLMLARKRVDGVLRCASTNFHMQRELQISDLSFNKEDDWVNYPKAVIHHLKQRGYSFSGADLLYSGTIPNGAGLSSSASIEVVTGFGMIALEGNTIDPVELALAAQEAENQFMGVNCGIMDQFAVAMGRKDHAIMLNCDTLDYTRVPFAADGYKLIIGNTNKRRGLVDSEYNARRAQCEEAVRYLQVKFPDLNYLCELTPDQLENNRSLIPDPIVYKRAEHAIQENHRVVESVKALQANDLERFGRFMNDSHESLKELYEVTCFELDIMVEKAQQVPGVLGSRMTGAGFGGCTVSLVADNSVDQFIADVGKLYKDKTGLDADFYVCEIGDGVKAI